MFALDTSARTLAIGGSADEIATTVYGGISFYQSTTGFQVDVDGSNDFFIKDITGNYSVLTIPNGTGGIYNRRDNGGIYTGVGDDLRIYHDGATSWITNITGALAFKNTGGDIISDLGTKWKIRDSDDGDANLIVVDTTLRTVEIGSSSDVMKMETWDFSDIVYTQASSNPALQGENDIGTGVSFDQGVGWISDADASTTNVNSLEATNPMLDFPANEYDAGRLSLKLMKVRVNVGSGSTYSANNGSSLNITLSWHYSIDGGTSFTQGGTVTYTTTSSGNIVFDNMSADVDGDAITGDIIFKIHLETTGSSAIDSLDIGSFSGFTTVAFKTPQA